MILILNGKQYALKYVTNMLPCNYILYQMKVIQTDYCRFFYVPDALLHMFLECPYVQMLWKTIWQLFTLITAESIITEMCNIILCIYNKENQIFTLIYTIVQAYILHVNMQTNT